MWRKGSIIPGVITPSGGLIPDGSLLFPNPTAGAAPFSPTQISGLTLWLKADTGTFQDSALTTPATADGDPVGGWVDQSGNSNNVLQTTSTKRPMLRLAALNGLPVVRFDGVDDFLRIASFTFNQPWTTLAVVKVTDFADYRYVTDGQSDDRAVLRIDAADGKVTVYAGNAAVTTTAGLTAGVAAQVTGVFNGASSAVYKDGGSSATGNAGSTGITALVVGISGGQTIRSFYGDIAELLIYNSALSASNQSLVEAYLKTRWGTP